MSKLITGWLKIWLHVLAGVGVILLIVLIANWTRFDWIFRLSLIGIIAITIHVWEEERIPGGFHYWFNTMQNSHKPDRYPMNEFIAMAVDYSTIIAFITILLISHGAVWFGITIALFCCLETAIHTASGLICLKRYRFKGKRTIYVPGTASSLLVFLPTAIAILYYLVSNKLASGQDWFIGISVTLLILATTVKGLEGILKDENSPYVAPEKYRIGYFRKFI